MRSPVACGELAPDLLGLDAARLKEDEEVIKEVGGLADQGGPSRVSPVFAACCQRDGGEGGFDTFLPHLLGDALDAFGEQAGGVALCRVGAGAGAQDLGEPAEILR